MKLNKGFFKNNIFSYTINIFSCKICNLHQMTEVYFVMISEMWWLGSRLQCSHPFCVYRVCRLINIDKLCKGLFCSFWGLFDFLTKTSHIIFFIETHWRSLFTSGGQKHGGHKILFHCYWLGGEGGHKIILCVFSWDTSFFLNSICFQVNVGQNCMFYNIKICIYCYISLMHFVDILI